MNFDKMSCIEKIEILQIGLMTVIVTTFYTFNKINERYKKLIRNKP
jgi:hypothetical protein